MKGILFLWGIASVSWALERPNIILYYADDISARELPVYGSSVWTDPVREDTRDERLRAQTPVLNEMASSGCWIETAWAACVCNPSRAMMMSGRHGYKTKWWNNKDKGLYRSPKGTYSIWPIYESSPILMGHAAQAAGYGTFWAGKTQVVGDWEAHGFDEGCFTPGSLSNRDNPYTDFKHEMRNIEGEKVLVNVDTGLPADTYMQHGWYWYPHVKVMNHPSAPDQTVWWPHTTEAKASYGLHTYGPDVELDFAFDFMERQREANRPFLIYHTSHLGHDGFNWFEPDHPSRWPGTPKIRWTGSEYVRTAPQVTGDQGVYDLHDTVTEPGIHHHINYIDYQMWLYRNKLEELGIADNTVIIFCADNGTGGYGKNSGEKQKGCHVPMIIYAPGMTKQGRQEVLMSVADLFPTVADWVGFKVPDDYEIDGESLLPFLFTEKATHRDWIYTQRGPEQLIRSRTLLKDGRDHWWDVTDVPDDLISFKRVDSWKKVSEEQRKERDRLLEQLPQYDVYFDEFNAPGVPMQPNQKHPRYARKKK